MLRTFFLVLLATAASTASALTIRDAYPRYMHEDHFKTVTEYLRGEQKEGPREVVRTQPEDRTGQYFILTLDSSVKELPANAEIALDILPTNLREPLTYRFSAADFQTASRQLYLGITGQDWPDRQVQPMAWRVRLLSGDESIAEWKSFLWEMP